MNSRGIRGAITVENDTPENIEKATVELFSKIIELNDLKLDDVSHIIFTMTKDLKTAYPAKFLRKHFDTALIPLMCMAELDIEGSLQKCLRLLVVFNTPKTQAEIQHVYLGGARVLRSDLLK